MPTKKKMSRYEMIQAKKKKEQEEKERKEREAQEALEAKKEKLKQAKKQAKDAAPKVAEVDLNLASKIWTMKGLGTIFIGKKSNAQDADHLKELGITRVLNCAKEIPIPAFYDKDDIGYHHLLMEDKAAFEIENFFDEGADFIKECMEGKFKTLVHCQEGKSRSTSMVIAYFMKYQNMTCESALAVCAARRQLVQPNNGFMKKLKIYEQKLKKKEAGEAEEEEVEAKDGFGDDDFE